MEAREPELSDVPSGQIYSEGVSTYSTNVVIETEFLTVTKEPSDDQSDLAKQESRGDEPSEDDDLSHWRAL